LYIDGQYVFEQRRENFIRIKFKELKIHEQFKSIEELARKTNPMIEGMKHWRTSFTPQLNYLDSPFLIPVHRFSLTVKTS
jgi:hypothetical protein